MALFIRSSNVHSIRIVKKVIDPGKDGKFVVAQICTVDENGLITEFFSVDTPYGKDFLPVDIVEEPPVKVPEEEE